VCCPGDVPDSFAEVPKEEDIFVVCGNKWSSSEPLGTRGNVGRAVKVGIDMDGEKSWASESVDRESVAMVAPFGWEERCVRRCERGMSSWGGFVWL
jgi:hypothetical protein